MAAGVHDIRWSMIIDSRDSGEGWFTSPDHLRSDLLPYQPVRLSKSMSELTITSTTFSPFEVSLSLSSCSTSQPYYGLLPPPSREVLLSRRRSLSVPFAPALLLPFPLRARENLFPFVAFASTIAGGITLDFEVRAGA